MQTPNGSALKPGVALADGVVGQRSGLGQQRRCCCLEVVHGTLVDQPPTLLYHLGSCLPLSGCARFLSFFPLLPTPPQNEDRVKNRSTPKKKKKEAHAGLAVLLTTSSLVPSLDSLVQKKLVESFVRVVWHVRVRARELFSVSLYCILLQ